MSYNTIRSVHVHYFIKQVIYKSFAIRLNHSFKYIFVSIRECSFNRAHAPKLIMHITYYK